MVGLLFVFFSIIIIILYLNIDISQILKSNNIQNESFFIKLKEKKLSLSINTLKIPKIESSPDNNSTLPTIKEIFRYIKLFQFTFETIKIKNLTVENYFKGDIYYHNGVLKIRDQENIIELKIYLQNSKVYLDIYKLSIPKHNIEIKGKILFDYENNETVFKAHISLKDDVNISLAGEVEDLKNIKIRAEVEKIENLKPIFDILQLSESAYIWGIKKTHFKYINLKNISTSFPISNPELALKNLKVDGEILDLTNRFETNLDLVKIKKVELKIKDSNLHLELENMKFGKIKIQSKITIQNLYSKPHLFVKANTDIRNYKDILGVIKYYGNLENLPVSISGHLQTDFFMDMKLYDNLEMRFLTDLDIKKESSKSDDLLNINGGHLSFKYPENLLEIDKLNFSYQNITKGYLFGVVNLSNSELNINTFINKIQIDKNSSMKNKNIKFHVFGNFQKKIRAEVSESKWDFSNIPVDFSNFQIEYYENIVRIYNLHTDLKKFNLSTKINGAYFIDRNVVKTDLNIKKFEFSEVNISKENFQIFMHLKDNIEIKIPKILTEINIAKNKKISFGNVALFRKYVPLLNKYPKVSGFAQIYINDNILIKGSLNLKQKVLKYEDKFIRNFNFDGEIQNENFKISVNNKIFINKSENIDILIEDYDFNITGLNDFIQDSNKSEENNESNKSLGIDISPEINVYLNGTSLYLTDNNNSFHSKSIFFTAFKDKIYVKTDPLSTGEITVETKGDRYIVRAVNLKEEFITSISNFNGVSGGNYNIYLKGKKDNFQGFAQFRSLKIKDMDMINNILAFINTVPALLTFSRPGFNHNGLRIMAGYVEFQKIDDKIYFKDIQIKGESVDFAGSGFIDLENSTVDIQIDISAIKYIDKFIENIPVANYLILGDDGSIATRIIIKGKLNDPKISSELHKDILYSPFKLTNRVFNLPAKILEVFKSLNLNDKTNQENVKQFLNEIGLQKSQ